MECWRATKDQFAIDSPNNVTAWPPFSNSHNCTAVSCLQSKALTSINSESKLSLDCKLQHFVILWDKAIILLWQGQCSESQIKTCILVRPRSKVSLSNGCVTKSHHVITVVYIWTFFSANFWVCDSGPSSGRRRVLFLLSWKSCRSGQGQFHRPCVGPKRRWRQVVGSSSQQRFKGGLSRGGLFQNFH